MTEEKSKFVESKVFQVMHTIQREEDGERIIFNKTDEGWKYHAPNAQDHTEDQLDTIIVTLKALNAGDKLDK